MKENLEEDLKTEDDLALISNEAPGARVDVVCENSRDNGDDDDVDDDEDEEPVSLGFVSEKTQPWILARQNFPCKIGGAPAWLDPQNLPSGKDKLCDVCEKPLTFLLQVYAPLDTKPSAFHRTLFVFTCQSSSCLQQHIMQQGNPEGNSKQQPCKSVKVFRSQLSRTNPFYSYEPPSAEGGEPKTAGAVLCSWCATWRADNRCGGCRQTQYCCRDHQVAHWRNGHAAFCRNAQTRLSLSASDSGANDASSPQDNETPNTESSDASEPLVDQRTPPSSAVEVIPRVSKPLDSNAWPEFELRVEEEEEEEEQEEEGEKDGGVFSDEQAVGLDRTKELLRQYRERTKVEGEYGLEEMAGIEEEKSEEKRHWAEFQAKIAAAPQQVLRYLRTEQSKPLWPKIDGQPSREDIPLCESCGSKRIFEFQVLPQILYYLKVDSSTSDGLDFGSLAIFTCMNSCQLDVEARGYLKEFVWAQATPE